MKSFNKTIQSKLFHAFHRPWIIAILYDNDRSFCIASFIQAEKSLFRPRNISMTPRCWLKSLMMKMLKPQKITSHRFKFSNFTVSQVSYRHKNLVSTKKSLNESKMLIKKLHDNTSKPGEVHFMSFQFIEFSTFTTNNTKIWFRSDSDKLKKLCSKSKFWSRKIFVKYTP